MQQMKIPDKHLKIFAKLSGDFNPIHLDKTYASKSIFKTKIIYGIFQVFLALEKFLTTNKSPIHLLKISANFLTPILHGDKFYIQIDQSHNNVTCNIYLSNQNKPVSNIHFYFKNSKKLLGYRKNSHFLNKQPMEINELLQGGGATELFFNPELLRIIFPNCHRKLDNFSTATLLAITRIVGMQCPGLNSIFSSMELEFPPSYPKPIKTLFYDFKMHPILNCANISINNLLKGKIKAFIRPKPIENIKTNTLLFKYPSLKKELPFKHQRALVIGASNGLGNTCSKLLSIGGASVLASFNNTKVLERDSNIHFFQYNALNPTKEMLTTIVNFSPTHLYYFSTPKIQSIKNPYIQEENLQDFINHYIFGLNKILKLNIISLTTIFCPSTAFIETRPQDFKEYILAKSLLESFLSFLSQQYICIYPRIEKTLTNQTLEITKQNLPTTDEVILKEILTLKAKNM